MAASSAAAEEELQDVEKSEVKVSDVVRAPGIPVNHKQIQCQWFCPWLVAVLLFLFSGNVFVKPLVYREIYRPLPANINTVIVESAGCDVLIDEAKWYESPGMLVQYWTLIGSTGSITMSPTTANITGSGKRAVLLFRCLIRVIPPPMHRIKVVMHEYEKDVGPGNIHSIAALDIQGPHVRELDLHVESATQVVLAGVHADLLRANVSSGSVSIYEAVVERKGVVTEPNWARMHKHLAVPKHMHLSLADTVLILGLHHADLDFAVGDNTLDDTHIGGTNITNKGKSDGMTHFAVTRGPTPQEPTVTMGLRADGCGIYVLAESYDVWKSRQEVQSFTGSTVKQGPRFVRGAMPVLRGLYDYLKSTRGTQSQYVIYLELTAPHVPSGTFRLLSSPAYMGFSLPIFTMISGGMLQPRIIRIQLAVEGFDFLFPRRAPLSKDEVHEFVMGSFGLLYDHVINGSFANDPQEPLIMKDGVWIWDPAGPEAYIFEHRSGGHGKLPGWDMRLLGTQDLLPIQLAVYITLGIAVLLGLFAVMAVRYMLLPHILEKIRDSSLLNTASYQLQHVAVVPAWAVLSAPVSYPIDAVMIRWNTRPLQPSYLKMSVLARPWPVTPDGKMIQVDNIDPLRLPVSTSSPDQQMFLFATHPPETPLAGPSFASQFELDLFATAMLCVGNPALVSGMAYQFQVKAFGSNNLKPLEKSDWTNPCTIPAKRSFAEYPLLLWKSTLGILPEDTFQYFLDRYAMPIEAAPSLLLRLSKLRLAVVNDSPIFAGAYAAYGHEDDQGVTVAASTGSEWKGVSDADVLYEETLAMALPSATNPARKDKLKDLKGVLAGEAKDAKTAGSQEMGEAATAAMRGLELCQFFVIDFGSEVLNLRVGSDMEQGLRLEGKNQAVVDKTAKYESTWTDFVKEVLTAPDSVDAEPSHVTKRLKDGLVLRDGLSPVGLLFADVAFLNTAVPDGSLAGRTKLADNFTDVFDSIIPGSTFLWGEPLKLAWKHKEGVDRIRTFDIVLVSEEQVFATHQKPITMGAKHEVVLSRGVQVRLKKAGLFMTPAEPMQVFSMKCHLEAKGTDGTLLEKSTEFVVVRPVTLEDIEVGYATYCCRNNIPMTRVDTNRLGLYGIEVIERSFKICEDYRRPLPMTGTRDPEVDYFKQDNPAKGPPVVWSPGAYIVADTNGLHVLSPKDQEKEVEAAPPPPPQGSTSFGMPYIESLKQSFGSAMGASQPAKSAADIEGGGKELGTPVQVVSRVEFLKIPTNVYWRQDCTWTEDLLLNYSLLPTFAQEGTLTSYMESTRFAFTAHIVAAAIRFILQALLMWGQVLIISAPAWICIVLKVLFDVVDTSINPNMDAYAKVHQTYLFDFVVSPSVFSYKALGTFGEVYYAVCLGYMIFVVIATLYSNIVHNARMIKFLYYPLNTVLSVCSFAFFTVAVIYAGIICLWIIMGSIVDPGPLMIWAIAILGTIVLAKTMWSHTKEMRETVYNAMYDRLDHALHVLMEIMIGDAPSDAEDAAAMRATVKNTIAFMDVQEEEMRKKLYGQADRIVTEVDACARDTTLLIRSSAAFQAGIGGPDTCYATDFVPQDIWAEAQKVANEEADMKGTRKAPPPLQPTAVPDELIHPESLAEALAMSDLPTGSALNQDDENAVQVLCKKIGLRPGTGKLMHKAFEDTIKGAALKAGEMNILDPATAAAAFVGVRNDQLFRHFLWDEPAKKHFLWEEAKAQPPAGASKAGAPPPKAPAAPAPAAAAPPPAAAAPAAAAPAAAAPKAGAAATAAAIVEATKAGAAAPAAATAGAAKAGAAAPAATAEAAKAPAAPPAKAAADAAPAVAAGPKTTPAKADASWIAAPPAAAEAVRAESQLPEAQISTAYAYLLNIQDQACGDLDTILASALTEILNWQLISRKVQRFCAEDLNITCTHILDKELNPVCDGSASNKIMIMAYEKAYERFAAVYNTDEVQFFVDCGLIDVSAASNADTQAMCKGAINNFRAWDGSLSPDGLVKAIRWMIDPLSRSGPDGADQHLRVYFWYGALESVLKLLGWAPDEMEATWLKSRWMDITNKTGLLPYRSGDELNVMIFGLASNGLWKAAAMALMLQVNIGGYLACDVTRDGKEAAAKKAHLIHDGDHGDLKFLLDTCNWPPLVAELWDELAKMTATGEASPDGNKPKFLETVKLEKLLLSIIFEPRAPGAVGDMTFHNLVEYPQCLDDHQWLKGYDKNDKFKGLWWAGNPVKRRFRGLWLELFLNVATRCPTIPVDVDLYYDNFAWQLQNPKHLAPPTSDTPLKAKPGAPRIRQILLSKDVAMLQYETFMIWLPDVYVQQKRTCTLTEFHALLKDYMNCELDIDILGAQVFKPCPLVPDDDLGELRFLHHLGAALHLWMGYGLWKGAIAKLVDEILPRGKMRTTALQMLSEEFDKVDTNKIGVIQPGQALMLLKKLQHPGLNCDDLGNLLKNGLGLDVAPRDLHKSFVMQDINGDGLLQVTEFVCMMRYMMLDYYPLKIMRQMQLTRGQIAGIIAVIVIVFLMFIAAIKLVISNFTSGDSMAQAVQSGSAGMGLFAAKLQGDKQVGAGEAISNARAAIVSQLTMALAVALGLTPIATDKLNKLIKSSGGSV